MRPSREGISEPLVAKDEVFGNYMVARFRGITQQTLVDTQLLQRIVAAAFARVRIPMREFVVRHSNDTGLSLIALFEGAHLVIHTYPKSGAALASVYIINAQPTVVVNAISALMDAEHIEHCEVGVETWN